MHTTQERSTGRFARLRSSRAWRVGRWPLAGLVVLCVGGVVAVVALYAGVELPEEPPAIESSVVLAADGTELAVLAEGERRFEVTLDEVSDHVEHALVAAEDRRFHEHRGVDPIGIARAVWNNLRGGDTQGGSTITQQLVKNTYTDGERTLGRKVREALLAAKLESRKDKREILESYLNTVYFGRGAYGIEAAARTYFRTSASELDVGQSALLVGLLRAPEANDPTKEPEAATKLRDRVLRAMVDTGDLTREEADRAIADPLRAVPPPEQTSLTGGIAPHFVDWVRAVVTAELGESEVYSGGLTIHTTLVPEHQRAAEAVLAQVPAETDADAALTSVDAQGAVTAHVGSLDHATMQVDLARGAAGGGSGRQAGSTFKPFVLAAALSPEVPLGTKYPAPASTTIDLGEGPNPDGGWEVSNYGGKDHGVVTLEQATAESINTVYAQLAVDTGIDRVVRTAHDLGITGELAPHPSVALGAVETSPLDMAVAYNTLGQGGRHHPVQIVSSVIDGQGEERWAATAEARPGIDEGVAAAVTRALTGVIDEGTGTAAAIGRPAAGKTGTTQDSGDAWFVGYTPHRSTAVWLGHAGARHTVTDGSGRPMTGGGLPARLWAEFMRAATADDAPDDFPKPPSELTGAPRATRRPAPSDRGDTPAREEPDRSAVDDGGADSSSTTTTSTSAPASSTTVPDRSTTTSAPKRSTTTTTAPNRPTTTTTTTPEDDTASRLEVPQGHDPP